MRRVATWCLQIEGQSPKQSSTSRVSRRFFHLGDGTHTKRLLMPSKTNDTKVSSTRKTNKRCLSQHKNRKTTTHSTGACVLLHDRIARKTTHPWGYFFRGYFFRDNCLENKGSTRNEHGGFWERPRQGLTSLVEIQQ